MTQDCMNAFETTATSETEVDMPYARNLDLPTPVRAHLPTEAQDIYREAFNHAWKQYAKREPERIEEIAHRVAWSAVKRCYRKSDGAWVPLPSPVLKQPAARRRTRVSRKSSRSI